MSCTADWFAEREAEWVPAGQVAPLAASAVHVWRADLASVAASVASLAQHLDRSERARAAAFHAASDADRYVLAHGILRVLLARYLDVGTAAIRYEFGPHGKPRLAESFHATDLTFNMSHTHDVIVFAFARGREVGIDVERWAAEVECLTLANYFFSRTEREALSALPPAEQQAGFFNCWSRKEAYIKATGMGVSHGLDHFDVTLAPGDEAALLGDRSVPDAVRRWRMRDLGFAPGHSGALVAEGDGWMLHRFAVVADVVDG